jgi:hypothetical protein
MKIKQIIYLLALFLVLLPNLSCEKFLEQTDTSPFITPLIPSLMM